MLTDEQIRTLWKQFDVPAWAEWQKGYQAIIEEVRQIPDEELVKPHNQKLLWSARSLSSLGPGDSVNVSRLIDDKEVANALVALRSHSWPKEPEKHAEAIQAEFERIFALIEARQIKPRPIAKLQRIFVLLLPEDLACLFNWKSYRRASELLLSKGSPALAGQFLMRKRLRDVLGPEKDLTEHVRRSAFCWWIHEKYEPLRQGKIPLPDENKNNLKPEPDPEPLVIWPFAKQFKGNIAFSYALEAYQSFIQGAVEGITPDDLIELMSSDTRYARLARKSLRMVLLRIQGLGFLEQRNGLLFPSDAGHALLEGESDILVERLIERVFGFAQLLRFLEQNPQGISRPQSIAALQALYPQWTSSRMPGHLRAWLKMLGLMEKNEQKLFQLTEYGQTWARRLPTDLPKPPPPVEDLDEENEEESGSEPNGSGATEFPSLTAILQKFRQDSEVSSFVFDDDLIASLHAAWHSNPRKHFVILSGLSGTGKTALTLCYARVVCELLNKKYQEHLALVPVSPDWRDPTGLLGYFNALHADPTFQAEPALRLVLRAVRDPGHPYFLLLDEMNLARVERYFAPFLSAMETGESLVLHAHEEPVNDIPPRVPWPSNLFIAGTVNMDETTHAFSDKVLDRAFTLELWDVDLAEFFARRAQTGATRFPEVESFLIELNQLLYAIRRHFGYRTAGEVLSFLQAGRSHREDALLSLLLDQAVFSKILPRLRGEDTPTLREVLKKASALCEKHQLTRCARKLSEMHQLLLANGFTKFWS